MANTAWKTREASPKQIYWINKLMDEKEAPIDTIVASTLIAVRNGFAITGGQASDALDYLFKAPTKTDPNAPAPLSQPGMYSHEGAVYKVQRSQRGNLYAKIWVNTPTQKGEDRWHLEYAAGAVKLLSDDEQLSFEDEAEWNKKTGRCSRCDIRLEDPASLARGFGPVCYKKAVLAFQKREV